jgi:hypothetical protein
MGIAAGGIGLPEFDQGVGDGTAIAIEQAAGDDDALTEGLTGMLGGQVAVPRLDGTMAEERTGELGEGVGQQDEGLGGMAVCGGVVLGGVKRRMDLPIIPPVARNVKC